MALKGACDPKPFTVACISLSLLQRRAMELLSRPSDICLSVRSNLLGVHAPASSN